MAHNAAHVGAIGAIAAGFGAVFSGPVAIAVVELTHPQPAWHGPAAFAASYHPIQLLPYALGSCW